MGRLEEMHGPGILQGNQRGRKKWETAKKPWIKAGKAERESVKEEDSVGKPVVHVLGLGPGPVDLLTLSTMDMLAAGGEILARTSHHPCVEELSSRGVRLRFLDHFYEGAGSLEEAYRLMAEEIRHEAEEKGVAYYAVPGHPLVAERSVQLLLSMDGLEVRLHPAVSFLDAVLCSLGVEPLEGLLLLDGERLAAGEYPFLDPRLGSVIAQVDSRLKASDVKLSLLEVYPPEHELLVVSVASTEGERVERVSLEELDRAERFDHLTSIYVPPLPEAEIRDFRRLMEVVARLRGPGGCPWDRRQTHETLARHMVEEAHEAVDAIRHRDWDHLCEELGDLLLQVALHAQLGQEEGAFDMGDVLRLIIEKLVRRHPHVFGEAELHTTEEVVARWEQIKAEEREGRAEEGGAPSLLDGVAEGLPSLVYAFKLQSRAARVGFDWQAREEVLPKLQEELREIEEVLRRDEGDLEGELGDMLFTLVNVCRHYRVDPEVALRRASRKFASRFQEMERKCREEERDMNAMSLEELDHLWEESKGG